MLRSGSRDLRKSMLEVDSMAIFDDVEGKICKMCKIVRCLWSVNS